MKRLLNSLFLTLFFMLTCCFSACSSSFGFHYSYDVFNEGLQKCEIIYIQREDYSVETLVILNEEQTHVLLQDLSELGFWMEMPPPGLPIAGICLKLTYQDYYWIIGDDTGTEYTLAGEVITHTSGVASYDAFMELLSQYAELPGKSE